MLNSRDSTSKPASCHPPRRKLWKKSTLSMHTRFPLSRLSSGKWFSPMTCFFPTRMPFGCWLVAIFIFKFHLIWSTNSFWALWKRKFQEETRKEKEGRRKGEGRREKGEEKRKEKRKKKKKNSLLESLIEHVTPCIDGEGSIKNLDSFFARFPVFPHLMVSSYPQQTRQQNTTKKKITRISRTVFQNYPTLPLTPWNRFSFSSTMQFMEWI